MKKVVLLVMAAFLSVALFGCVLGNNPDQAAQESNTAASSDTKDDTAIVTPTEPEAYEITYQNVHFTTSSDGSVVAHLIVEITNTGILPLYLRSDLFELETSDSEFPVSLGLVTAYPQIIESGEKGYYATDTEVDNIPVGASVQIVPHLSIERATAENLRFQTGEITLKTNSQGGIMATGRVKNNTSTNYSRVEVAVVLYDENDTPLDVLHDVLIGTLEAGGELNFSASDYGDASDIRHDSVDHCTAVAYLHALQI
ncbi:MAG: FxLYD domain-containing protein [Coriobacteriales bacterium]|jgi:hypothetical protein|nr:FxLYD domain-containing protein [Coriobacteriales bacterium]